jgi:hypothetical protein
MLKRALICILVLFFISGCSKSVATLPATPTPEATLSAVASALPAILPSLPAVTPTSSASPTPFTSFTVKPSVDNLKIRVNPGYLFEALMMVQQTDELTVMGTAPGNEWTYVKTVNGDEGWVFSELLTSNVDLAQIPVRQPKNTQVIKAQVLDVSGLPIQGVVFDVSQGGADGASTNTVVTDGNGIFYSFMPETASGAWTVTYSGIACDSNVWSDSTCTTYKPGFTGVLDPQTQTVTLPQTSGQLVFTYR